jgi:AmpD protein
MDFSLKENLLCGARLLNSPNQSDRNAGQVIDLLVIHNISLPPGEFASGCIDDLFCNRLDREGHPFFTEIADLKVSAHLLIDREGQVTQYVPFNKKAWHAGESSFYGKSNCNDYSLGIELEGTDDEAFTAAQYDSLTSISNLLLVEYPCLNLDRIVGHSEVAPGRKTDPGPCFDWDRYKGGLTRHVTRKQGV